MIHAILSFLTFVLLLGGIAYGTSWIVDNKPTMKVPQENSIENIRVKGDEVSQLDAKDTSLSETKEEIQENVDEKEIDKESMRKEVDLVVLNGGGAVGSAGALAKLFEGVQYANVRASNASSYEYTDISIYFQEGKEEEAKVALEDMQSFDGYLEKKLEIKSAENTDQKGGDIVVIIGE